MNLVQSGLSDSPVNPIADFKCQSNSWCQISLQYLVSNVNPISGVKCQSNTWFQMSIQQLVSNVNSIAGVNCHTIAGVKYLSNSWFQMPIRQLVSSVNPITGVTCQSNSWCQTLLFYFFRSYVLFNNYNENTLFVVFCRNKIFRMFLWKFPSLQRQNKFTAIIPSLLGWSLSIWCQ